MKFLSIDNPLARFLDKLVSLILINLCFVVFSIPIITIGASATAMYRCFLTMAVDGSGGEISLFWKSFKSNFKQSTLLELCILPALAISIAEIIAYFSGIFERRIIFGVGLFLPFVIIACIVSYVFPMQAQFENRIMSTIKNAALIAIAHLPTTVIITALNLIFPITACFMPALFFRLFSIWIICGFSLVSYINTSLLRNIFVQYFPPAVDAQPKDEPIE